VFEIIIIKKKNNERRITNRSSPPNLKNYYFFSVFFRASKIKFGLVDFHGLLARLACGLKSFS